jgi:hypothetical protein
VQDRAGRLTLILETMSMRIKMRTACGRLRLTLGVRAMPSFAADDDFGTIGIRFEQLYGDAQPGKHGPLVVLGRL